MTGTYIADYETNDLGCANGGYDEAIYLFLYLTVLTCVSEMG